MSSLMEIIAWTLEVERSTIYLYNSDRKCLYVKASTGRVREMTTINKKDDMVYKAFITGKSVCLKSMSEEKKMARMGLDNKLGVFT